MQEWVLIVALSSAVLFQSFNSKDSCDQAANKVQEMTFNHAHTECVYK